MSSSLAIVAVRLRAAACATVVALAVLLDVRSASANTNCDPFKSTLQTTVAPDNSAAGSIHFLINSSGCPTGADPGKGQRFCADQVAFSMNETIQAKCLAIINQINTPSNACGTTSINGNFSAAPDATNCADGVVTITDLTCDGQEVTSQGVTFMIGNSASSLQGNGFLPDYEFDTITNGCQATGGASAALLSGTPTGTAINGNSPSVVLAVSTPDKGTGSTTVATTPGMTPAAIVAQAVTNINGALSAVGSTVQCATTPGAPGLVSCNVGSSSSGGGGLLPAAKFAAGVTAPLAVPCTFQLNDSGMKRFLLSGPAADVQNATTAIVGAGGSIPSLATFNINAATATAAATPAMNDWAVAGLFALLAAVGLVFVQRRGVSHPTAS